MHGDGSTSADRPDVSGIKFDRRAAGPTLGQDAHKDHYVIAGIKETLQLEVPFAPRFPDHGGEPDGALSPAKYRLPLRVVGQQTNLKLLVEVVAERSIDLIRVMVRKSPPRTGSGSSRGSTAKSPAQYRALARVSLALHTHLRLISGTEALAMRIGRDGLLRQLAPLCPPILFAAFPLLSLYAHNQTEVELGLLWWPLAWCVAAAVLLYGVFMLIFKRGTKAGALASLGTPRAATASRCSASVASRVAWRSWPR
jgi:hypothetical protein